MLDPEGFPNIHVVATLVAEPGLADEVVVDDGATPVAELGLISEVVNVFDGRAVPEASANASAELPTVRLKLV
jgi:hypothetical protein